MFDFFFYCFVCVLILFFFPQALTLSLTPRGDGEWREADYHNPQKYREYLVGVLKYTFHCVCVCACVSVYIASLH